MKDMAFKLFPKISKVLSIALIAAVSGCSTATIVKKHCEDWANQGTASGGSDNLLGLSGNHCRTKCNCSWTDSQDSVSCESGKQSYCFTRCMTSWGLECNKWVDVSVTVDFITREEKK